MYLSSDHVEKRTSVLQEFIKKSPLGVLTTALPSEKYPFIQSTHIPWILDVKSHDGDHDDDAQLGVLRGHIARANPQSRAIVDALNKQGRSGRDTGTEMASGSQILEQEVLVLFTHSVQHYVTPLFYVETKSTTQRMAPTWNYSAVQAYGRARFYTDSLSDETTTYLKGQLEDLSRMCEVDIMNHTGQSGRSAAWEVSDAPEKWIDGLRRQIIGVEIEITRLEGKLKVSQEMSLGDARGVVRGFWGMRTDLGRAMARLVMERYDIRLAGKRAKAMGAREGGTAGWLEPESWSEKLSESYGLWLLVPILAILYLYLRHGGGSR